ncbi:MAG: transketolase family protein, partial [Gammaproteobacteria bacterium]
TYVFLGDGCMMEGISHEACSLAGTLGLGKLICLYDDNGISIDGEVDGWFRDNTPERFRAYGWQVIAAVDGHDAAAVHAAIADARGNTTQPTLICCKTVIGFGSPNLAGTAATHGAPLGDEEIQATREALGWESAPFEIPEHIYSGWNATEQGQRREAQWQELLQAYQAGYPELAEELERRFAGELPAGWADEADAAIAAIASAGASKATRKASLDALNVLAPLLPELIGGSADLSGSNCTKHAGSIAVSAEQPDGNYINYGVREFGMAAIINGLSLHGGVIPYGGTFLTFSDYARNALRMAALMKIQGIFVFTHDSIGLGEDGPTHQPVEHVASLRLMPNMYVWRPCDDVETAVAWRDAIERRDAPVSLVLTRQGLPSQPRDEQQLSEIRRGGYILRDAEGGKPDVILIATGSEVQLACASADLLASEGKQARVVSMPCVELFNEQDQAWQDTVLPPELKARVAIEAGVTQGWHKFTGDAGRVIGLDRYGESAPAAELFEHFGFSPEHVTAVVRELVN